jgi:hypothetical protein
MILFRFVLGLTLVDSATCVALTGEAVETEGSRIPDANANKVVVYNTVQERNLVA